MGFNALQYALWFANALAGAVLLFALIRRNQYRSVPAFSAYVTFDFCGTVLAFLILRYLPHVYLVRFSFLSLPVRHALAFLMLLGLWKHALREYAGLWKVARWLLGWTFVTMLFLVEISNANSQALFNPNSWFSDWMNLLERTILFTQAATLLAFFAFLGHYRVRVSSLIRGLSTSWFFFSLVNVALFTFRYVGGTAFQTPFSIAKLLVFLVLLATWTGIVWSVREERIVEVAPLFVVPGRREEIVERMERINRSLVGLLKN